MIKMTFFSLVAASMLFTAHAEEVKTEDKNMTAPKLLKAVTPTVQEKRVNAVVEKCVTPAKPSIAAKPSKPASSTVKPITPAKPATPASGTMKPVTPAIPAVGTCVTPENEADTTTPVVAK